MNMQQKASISKGVVYLLLSPSQKRYVGQTFKSLNDRLSSHRQRAKRKHHPLYDAIRKYGWENFRVRVLCECYSQEDLDRAEQFFIQYYNSIVPNGYNISPGGGRRDHWNFFDEGKKREISGKLSVSIKKACQNPALIEVRRNASKNRHWTMESKEKLRATLNSPEIRRKRSISQIKARSTSEQRQRISERSRRSLNTPEAKVNLSKAQIKIWADPEIYRRRCQARRSETRKEAESQFVNFCMTHQRFTRLDLQSSFGIESGVAGKLIREGMKRRMIRPWTLEEQLQLRKSSSDRLVVYFVTDPQTN